MYHIAGFIDKVRLQLAVQFVFGRHETLRSAIFADEHSGDIIQRVLTTPRHTWRHQTGSVDLDAEAEFERMKMNNYDLKNGVTLDVTLLSLSESNHYLIVGYHHIILDGASWQLVLQDIARVYNSGENIPPPRVQYIDFSRQERAGNGGDSNYWRTQLQPALAPLPPFPFALRTHRRILSRPSMRYHEIVLSAEMGIGIRDLCRSLGVTMMHFHLGVLQVLLSKLTISDDFFMGVADAGRHDKRFAEVVGFMTRLLPLRLKLQDDESFAEVVRRARITTISAVKNSGASLDNLRSEIGHDWKDTQTPLVQVCLNYVSGFTGDIALGNAVLKYNCSADAIHPQDLVLTVAEHEDRSTTLSFALQEDLYALEHAKLMAKMYTTIINAITEQPQRHIANVDHLEPALRAGGLQLGRGLRTPMLPATSCPNLSRVWLLSTLIVSLGRMIRATVFRMPR
jgi:hypothetical protein